jgi:ATP-dependent RNA helicase DeaD
MTNTDAGDATNGFATLGVDPRIADALSALGYEEPTPVQRASIPPLLAGRDVLAQAATGTGKTAAFSLPLLTRIGAGHRASDGGPSVLMLVPTRELAMQVAEAVHRYGKPLGAGGAGRIRRRQHGDAGPALKRGVDVVIATPGRALDHIRRNTLKLSALQAVVLDEADEMLDMGFADELEPFSTPPPAAADGALQCDAAAAHRGAYADKHLRDPVQVTVERELVPEGESARVRQVAYIVSRAHKMPALARVLDLERPRSPSCSRARAPRSTS